MIVTIYSSLFDVRPHVRTVTWDEFCNDEDTLKITYVKDLTEREQKVPLYSFAELRPGRTRENDGVSQMHAFVADLDDLSPEQLEAILSRLRSLGLAFLFHTTFSHALFFPETGLICGRLILPLSRPVPAGLWLSVWKTCNKFLMLGATDEQTKDVSRAFFFPCAPTDTPENATLVFSEQGKPLDVDQLEVEASTVICLPGGELAIQELQEKVEELKRSKKHQRMRELLLKLLAGEPLAGAESHLRHKTLRDLTLWMSKMWPEASANAIGEHFKPSLAAMALESPDAPTYDQLLRLITGAQTMVEEQKVSKENHAAIEQRNAISRAIEGRTTPYTYSELEQFARDANITLEQFKARWIAQFNASYYVFVNGRYDSRALTEKELVTAVRDLLAPASSAGVELVRYTEKGHIVRKTAPELMAEYGFIVPRIMLDMVSQSPKFDASAGEFVVATCPRRLIKPERSELVDTWLGLLGGPKQDALRRWIARVTRQDLASSALFLVGAPGAGKTLLAKGLSRIWTLGGPVKLSTAIDSSFNSDMSRCPLIVGDEQIPRDFRGRMKTAELRELITEEYHRYRQKNKDDVVMRGCPRVILSSNNEEMFRTAEFLSEDDIRAITQRILTIRVTDEAKNALEGLSREEKTLLFESIAPHALWLAENLKPEENGSRLLVDGDETAAQTMAMSSGLRSPVLHWLAQYVLDPITLNTALAQRRMFRLIRIYKGELLVSAPALLAFWTHFATNRRPPEMRELSQALKGVSKGRIQLDVKALQRKPKYWTIDLDLLKRWVEDSGFYTVEEIENALARPQAEDEDDVNFKEIGKGLN